MAAQLPLAVTPSNTSAINRHVLQVLPTTPVAKVIEQMSAATGSACTVGDKAAATIRRVSCAMVVDNDKVVGILTERDIVKLTATQPALGQSLADVPVSTVMTTPVKMLEESAFQDIFAVLFLFRRYRIRHLPIVDKNDQLIGVVTPASIRSVLRPANLLKMRRVGDVMSREVIHALPTVSVMGLARLMAEHRVSCVVIVEAEATEIDLETQQEIVSAIRSPVGIVTERDIVQFQALGLNLNRVKAEAVMSAPLFLLDPKDSLWEAHEAMKQRRVRRLVVSWNWGQGLGIITQTSLLRVFDPIEMCGVIDSLQDTVQQLQLEDGPAFAKLSAQSASRRPTSARPAAGGSAVAPVASESAAAQAPSRSPQRNDNQLVRMLGQAANCIENAHQSNLKPTQEHQLSEATQIIKQVTAALLPLPIPPQDIQSQASGDE